MARSYSEVWKADYEARGEARRKGITPKSPIKAVGLTPSEWLKQKVEKGEAFWCEKRSATLTNEACRKVREKKRRAKVEPTTLMDDDHYMTEGLCSGCTRFNGGRLND